jgi:hypothetical protein
MVARFRLALEMGWSDVVKDNPWLAPVVAVTATGVAFATAGPIWGLFNVYLFAFLALIAWSHSRTQRKVSEPLETTPSPQVTVQDAEEREPEPWAKRSGADLTHPLELVPEMADSAATDAIPPVDERPPGFKPVRRPVLDAMVASTREDPAGVRRALRSWVKQASSPDNQKERQAQLHYWLYRAGETDELDKLKALAAANPSLAEVNLYLHLAQQDYGELWS